VFTYAPLLGEIKLVYTIASVGCIDSGKHKHTKEIIKTKGNIFFII
jgi:hypothetical protein